MTLRTRSLLFVLVLIAVPSRGEHAGAAFAAAATGVAAGAAIAQAAIAANSDVKQTEQNNMWNYATAVLVSNSNSEIAEKNVERAKIETNASVNIAAINNQAVTQRTVILTAAQERAQEREIALRMRQNELDFARDMRAADLAEKTAADARDVALRAVAAQEIADSLRPRTESSALDVRPVVNSSLSR